MQFPSGVHSPLTPLCASKESEGARSSFSLSVDLDTERELPGPSAFDFDFPLFHLSRSRTFPHGLAGRSTLL